MYKVLLRSSGQRAAQREGSSPTIAVVRDATVGFLISSSAFLVIGLLDLGMQTWAAGISDRPIGFTNVSTMAQAGAAFLLFFACGYFGDEWGRTRFAIVWLLTPIGLLCAMSIIQTPYLYRWNAGDVAMTLFIYAPFLLPVAAALAGCASQRLTSAADMRVDA